MLVDTLADYSERISDCNFELTEERRAWLTQLDADPSPLLKALGGKPPKRLGLYFEALWQFFLEEDPHTELIAHNLAVHDNGRTLGEFDCLYFDKQKEHAVHLELAVKYFLAYQAPSSNPPDVLWYGPNSKDRLDLKLAHMLDRQIMLGEHPAAQERLKELEITTLKKAIVFHGYLFNTYSSPLSYPNGHHSAGQGGRWLALKDLSLLRQDENKGNALEFIILPRQRWLSPAVTSADDEILALKQLGEKMNAHFSESSRPQLIASLDDEGKELERFFVTPDLWPQLAEEKSKTSA
jgi:uncharacterized protein